MASLFDFISSGAQGLNGLLGGYPGQIAMGANNVLGGIPGNVGRYGEHELQALGLLTPGLPYGQPAPTQQSETPTALHDYSGQTPFNAPAPNADDSLLSPVNVTAQRPMVNGIPIPDRSQIKPDFWNTLWNVASGDTPAMAADRDRARQYDLQMAHVAAMNLPKMLQGMSPEEQASALADLPGYLKARQAGYTEQMKPVAAKLDQRVVIPIKVGGSQDSAAPGEFSITPSGQVLNSATGPTGQTTPVQVTVPAGSTGGFVQAPGMQVPQIGPQGPTSAPLDPVAAIGRLGYRPTSLARTPAQNAAVGGVPNSQHMSGTAADFGLHPGETADQAAQRIKSLGIPGLQVIPEGPGAAHSTAPHVHVQWGGAKQQAASGGVPSTIQGKTYYTDAQGVQHAPDGQVSLAPTTFSPADQMKFREQFKTGEPYQTHLKTATAINSLQTILKNSSDNNGFVSMSALDNTLQVQTGLSAKAGSMNILLSEQGVADQVANKLGKAFLNEPITPTNIAKSVNVLRSYGVAHQAVAQKELDQENAYAKAHGFDMGVSLPTIDPMPNVKWMSAQDQARASAGTNPPTPARGPQPGFVSKGYKFKGGDPSQQSSWEPVH